MEPRGEKRKAPATSSEDTSQGKIAKRPARGYHTYRNGLMNVTPKRPEHVQAAEANSKNCPLLRLPEELRNKIWREVIGGYIVSWQARLSPYRGDLCIDPHKWSLLRTCRQIYSETALLPYTTSVFSGAGYKHWSLCNALRRIKAAFRQHIKAFQLPWLGCSKEFLKELQELLPGLAYLVFLTGYCCWSPACCIPGKYKCVYYVKENRVGKGAFARLFPQVGIELEHDEKCERGRDRPIGLPTWFLKRDE